MDPNQTYLDMYHAMRDGDHETARELALALKEWLARGGFYPYQYTPTEIDAYIANVLRRTAGGRPIFTLVCQYCDAGGHIQNEAQAIAEGWSDIEPAFDLPQANYCGVCPDCRTPEA